MPSPDPAGVEIRMMRDADLPEAIALLAGANIAPVAPSVAIPHPERTDLIVDNTYVAVADGRLVGVRSFIQLSPTEGEGASLAVDPAYRGTGLAERLWLTGCREMYRRGIRTIRGETDKPDWFVERLGYRVVGTVPKRHPFGRLDVDHWTVIELDLGTVPGIADAGD